MVARVDNIDDMQSKVMGISAGENGKALVSYPHQRADGSTVYKVQEMNVITGKNGYVGRAEKDRKDSGKTIVDRIMVANGGKITRNNGRANRGRKENTLVRNSAIYFENSDGGIQGKRGTWWHGTYKYRDKGFNQKSSLGCIVAPEPYDMDIVAAQTFKNGGVFYNVVENKELPRNIKKGDG